MGMQPRILGCRRWDLPVVGTGLASRVELRSMRMSVVMLVPAVGMNKRRRQRGHRHGGQQQQAGQPTQGVLQMPAEAALEGLEGHETRMPELRDDHKSAVRPCPQSRIM
jgi:hypothetical protein